MAELIDEEFGDWMETASVQPYTGSGAWDEGHGAAVAVPCHWKVQNKVITTSEGKTLVSSVQVQAGARWRSTLNEGAKVTLPGDPRVYTVTAVATWPGADSQVEVDLV
ncbi:head-to-tail stopper [Microbacterium phage Johann]|uniref:Head-to-tail stopper n=2 Tax=Goodmanvirus goodman TaxID=2734238 RepID=A0A3G3LZM8_9CAUD|nr:head-to-tail stopper [Microbacterium phage Goodman]AYQ99470.1 head-to-tail stopper [Microbacterium phage Goodman]AYQ99638.1 head-to-tail stopper [Microbacterium phage Johann]